MEKIEVINTSMEAEKLAFKAQLNTANELTSALAREKDDFNGLLEKEKAERVQLEITSSDARGRRSDAGFIYGYGNC